MVLPSSGPISLLDINSEYVANTEINGAQTAAVTTITVANASTFPTTGSLYVRGTGEVITYTGKTATTFTGCVRGTSGSVASALADKSIISVFRQNISLNDFYASGGYVDNGQKNGLEEFIPLTGEISLNKFYGGRASRALFSGGQLANSTGVSTIDYVTISTAGNATAFGGLRLPGYNATASSSATRAVFCGGFYNPNYVASIDYVTIVIAGNATSFGALTAAKTIGSAASSTTRSVLAGGWVLSSLLETAAIEYLTIANTGNSAAFGSLTQARDSSAAASSSTRAVFGGGYLGSLPLASRYVNTLDYVTIATIANATAFGVLATSRSVLGAASSSTRSIFGGGYTGTVVTSNVDYVTIATAGNATNFGYLTSAKNTITAAGSPTKAVFGGGQISSVATNNIDSVTIGTLGNASSFGTLTTARSSLSGSSNNHGGLYT
ncbi:hypothetical protein UFOVP244_158 [uncultured Caudovirales phage]|uniref:Uncharacterized protein n=1 Tax=uncultured Caudovirales phage TaxID=2100421 RepID=A0A6J7WZC1_9CAUD|nr:hypothetical protein UFOVP244_158 [uncultured Caudovirales phage]